MKTLQMWYGVELSLLWQREAAPCSVLKCDNDKQVLWSPFHSVSDLVRGAITPLHHLCGASAFGRWSLREMQTCKL